MCPVYWNMKDNTLLKRLQVFCLYKVMYPESVFYRLRSIASIGIVTNECNIQMLIIGRGLNIFSFLLLKN